MYRIINSLYDLREAKGHLCPPFLLKGGALAPPPAPLCRRPWAGLLYIQSWPEVFADFYII